MTEQKPKQNISKKKTQAAILQKAFDAKQDEIVVFSPKTIGDMILGRMIDYGTNKEFHTPFLVLKTENEIETTVFIKMGIIPTFQRKRWINTDDSWNEEAMDMQMGKLISFQYLGEATSDRSNRKFQKYKVLFPQDLDQLGIIKLE